MRIDSCRNCGSELKVVELCHECDQPLHFQCENCRKFVEDPIHFHEKIVVQTWLKIYQKTIEHGNVTDVI